MSQPSGPSVQTIQQLLRGRVGNVGPALRHGDREWTWRQHLAEASSQASALLAMADHDRPMHIGALLDNGPQMLTAMAAAGLGGYVLCGINSTRRGQALARDILRSDCQILLTDAVHRELLDGLELPGVHVVDTSADDWTRLCGTAAPLTPVPRSRRHRHIHDDLHVGDQW